MDAVRPPNKQPTKRPPAKGFWKRQARTWHFMSGAVCLVGLILFAVTGITLNHAHQIKASPVEVEQTMTLNATSLAALASAPLEGETGALARPVARAIERELGVRLRGKPVEWTEIDAYIALPRPGGDAWLSVDRETGEVLYSSTSRGAISYLNDLHKGRNTGLVWSWFLDVFAIACLAFALTGLWLLQIHAGRRASTWPLTALGLFLPILLLISFVHG